MNKKTKEKLEDALRYCINFDKSIEFAIQYMQDVARVDYDCVMKYLNEKGVTL